MAHGHSTLSKPSKNIQYCCLGSKTIKKGRHGDTKRLLKEFERGSKITLIMEFHRLKDVLFTAVKDTVQEKFVVKFIYRAAAWREAGLSASLYRSRLA